MKRILLTLIFLLSGCAGWESENVGTRSIHLAQRETGETLELIYAQDGSYDSAALRQINRLMRDVKTGEVGRIDPKLLNFITDIRGRLALSDEVVVEILSAYRSPGRNAALAGHDPNVARESWHTKGKAVDFRIRGVSGRAIAEIAKTMQRGGVAYYPKTDHVHVDIGGVRTWAPKR